MFECLAKIMESCTIVGILSDKEAKQMLKLQFQRKMFKMCTAKVTIVFETLSDIYQQTIYHKYKIDEILRLRQIYKLIQEHLQSL